MKTVLIEPGLDGRFLVTSRNFDASVAAELRVLLLARLEHAPTLLIDLSNVEFMDTAGLGAIASVADKARPGQLLLVGVTDRLARILARAPRLAALCDASATVSVRSA